MYVYFKENSAGFLVIYSCTVRGIVYLNIDKACSLSLSVPLPLGAQSRAARNSRHNKAEGAVQPTAKCLETLRARVGTFLFIELDFRIETIEWNFVLLA